MEELFRQQKGVIDTRVGYTGGSNDNPTYQSHPGHAEALEITFDTAQTSLGSLLDYFYNIHDPTTLNRQGNDIGDSYRSAIFYTDNHQLTESKLAIKRAQRVWRDQIVTALEPLTEFWEAEDYHQDFLQKNPGGYTCHYERH